MLPLIAIAALLAFRSKKQVLLRLQLKEGQTYLYKTINTQNITTQVSGQTIHAKTKMDMAMNVNVVKNFKEDSTLLKVEYKYFSMNVSGRGREIHFDSRDTTSGKGKPFKKLVSTTQEHPIIIKINSLGNILDIRGLNKISTAFGSSVGLTQQKKLKKMLNKNTFIQNFSSLGIFPKKAVSVGDHWEQTKTITNIASMNVHSTYTVKDIQPKSVVLNISSNISTLKDSITIRGMSIPASIIGDRNGSVAIDRNTGLISDGTINMNLTIKMSMMGKAITIHTKGKSNLSQQAEM